MGVLFSNPEVKPRKPRVKNLKKNMKVMHKPYKLVCLEDPELAVVVIPPALPGLNADGLEPKDEHGQWLRRCRIEGQLPKEFRGRREIVLVHAPGVKPYFADQKARVWELTPIPGVVAPKPRK